MKPASVSPNHRSLPPAPWTTSWLLLAPHQRRRTFSQRDVSLGEETSGNRWARVPDCTADGRSTGHSLLLWEIVWWNAPRIWRDFGSALPFQTRLTQTKPSLPLSKEHGSQVKDQGRRQCCHNTHKNYPIGLHVMYLYFPDTPHIYVPRCSHSLLHFSLLCRKFLVHDIGSVWAFYKLKVFYLIFLYLYVWTDIWHSVGSIVNGLRSGRCGSRIRAVVRNFFSSPERPVRLWGLPNLLFSGYRLRSNREVSHSSQSSNDIEWSWGLCVRFAGCLARTHNPQLHTIPTTWKPSTKYDRHQPLV